MHFKKYKLEWIYYFNKKQSYINDNKLSINNKMRNINIDINKKKTWFWS